MSSALKQKEMQTNIFSGEKRFSYADYLHWPEDVRAEIVNGIAYMMSPPSTIHQAISGKLLYLLYDFLEEKPCQVFAAPFWRQAFSQRG